MATLPLAGGTSLLVVWAFVNQKGPYLFVVDTGAGGVFLEERLGSVLNLGTGTEETGTGSGGTFAGRKVEGVSLNLGGQVELPPTPAMLAPLGPIRDLLPAPGISGVLGYELFARYTVEIDREQNVLRLYEPGSYKPPTDAVSLPLTLVGERMPVVKAAVGIGNDGQEYVGRFLLDTGFNSTVHLNNRFFRRYPVRKETKSLVSSGSGFGGIGVDGNKSPEEISRVNSFTLGELVFDKPLAILAGSPDSAGVAMMGIDGLIGGALLTRLHAVVDYPARRLYLRPNARFKEPFLLFRYGWLLAPDGDALVVRDVQPNSPAAKAGLRKDDRIVRVEDVPDLRGVSTSPVNAFPLPRWSPAKDRYWKIDVVRGKETVTLSFRPESL